MIRKTPKSIIVCGLRFKLDSEDPKRLWYTRTHSYIWISLCVNTSVPGKEFWTARVYGLETQPFSTAASAFRNLKASVYREAEKLFGKPEKKSRKKEPKL